MASAKDIGNKIRQIREEKEIPLSELARQTGISRGYLHLIEKGESRLTQEKLSEIANALGVLVAELVGEIDTYEDIPNIPDSLKKFADDYNLEPSDVIMLSKINYRGRQPKNFTEWHILYTVIKGTLSED